MQIGWDIPIEMDDGVTLRADVFRPVDDGKFPVILSYGPYAKGLSFQDGYKGNWSRLTKSAPEVLKGSSNKYQNWELVDPEKWVPDGYACVRVDSRGAGRSPGILDVWSPRETQDLYHCIEWAAMQAWSNKTRLVAIWHRTARIAVTAKGRSGSFESARRSSNSPLCDYSRPKFPRAV